MAYGVAPASDGRGLPAFAFGILSLATVAWLGAWLGFPWAGVAASAIFVKEMACAAAVAAGKAQNTSAKRARNRNPGLRSDHAHRQSYRWIGSRT